MTGFLFLREHSRQHDRPVGLPFVARRRCGMVRHYEDLWGYTARASVRDPFGCWRGAKMREEFTSFKTSRRCPRPNGPNPAGAGPKDAMPASFVLEYASMSCVLIP